MALEEQPTSAESVGSHARQSSTGTATPRFHAAANNKPKRASARHHREGAALDAWERQWQQLEDRFGVGLAGLSGLVLADPE